MKKLLIIFVLVNAFVSHPVHAVDVEFSKKREWFAGVGAEIGFDVHVLKSVGGGPAIQVGYRATKSLAILGQLNMHFSHDSSVNYYAFPFMGAARLYVVEDGFIYGGAGYYLLGASQGLHFRGTRNIIKQFYNGLAGHVGAGYDLWLSEKMFVTPQVGFMYARVGGIHRMIPQVETYFNWRF